MSISYLQVALPIFWLLFRILLPAGLPVLLPVALPILLPVALLTTTSGCSSGYYFRLHFSFYLRFHFRVLLQTEKGIAMHSLCETSCPPRTVHFLFLIPYSLTSLFFDNNFLIFDISNENHT